jgi:hypothetical protein
MMTHPATRAWDRISSIMLTTSELERLSAGAKHGTHARYNAHLLAGDEPCDSCRDAEAAYRAELRERWSDRDTEQAGSHLFLRSRRAFEPATALLEAEDDGTEEEGDENQDERSWVDDLEDADEYDDELEDEEGFEPDDAPPATSRAANLMQTWETIGRMGGLRLGPKAASGPRAPRRSRIASPSIQGQEDDPKTRLRVITAALDARHPRGPEARKLLAESIPYIGGVTFLRQYGEARGCDPEDVEAVERAAMATRERRR